jgi:5'-nucleotidase
MIRSFRLGALVALCIALAACQVHREAVRETAPARADNVALRLIALNDFHGYLEPSPYRAEGSPAGAGGERLAGGAVALAGVIERLRAEQPNSLVVGAGDLIGASPLSSSLLRDEPAIEAMGRMGVLASAVGNHEFDHGLGELMRLQNGGCPAEGCAEGEKPFAGASFEYLAANLLDAASGDRIFPAYKIEIAAGVPIAFVGAVLRTAPEIVIAKNIAGLRFADEAESINALVPQIRALGARAIVVLIHEGAVPGGAVDPDTCAGLQGPILEIVRRLDPEIDVVVSAHTHREYVCRYDGRLLTQGGSYGHVATAIDLTIARDTHDVVAAQARNVVADPTQPSRDPAFAALVEDAKARTAVIAQRPIARLGSAQIRRTLDANGESALGRFLADVQLEAARELGARVACMNPGGVRQHLPALPKPLAPLTFADLQAVHPFGNRVTVLALSGAQVKQMLEQQWKATGSEGMLSCSRGFTYRFDEARPLGERITAGSIELDGKPIDSTATYRIAVNSFLAGGGDSYPVFKQAKPVGDAGLDLDVLIAYLKEHEPAKPATDVRAQGKFGD